MTDLESKILVGNFTLEEMRENNNDVIRFNQRNADSSREANIKTRLVRKMQHQLDKALRILPK